MYEPFEHTADIGLKITAKNKSELFIEACKGFYSLLIDDPTSVEPKLAVSLEVQGEHPELLLRDLLAELLYLFDTEKLCLRDFEVTFTPSGLHLDAKGEHIDLARHKLMHEVKAVTYHNLQVTETPHGWLAEVIFDI
ncbi:MAG: archease [Acidobacteriota bacterium]|nr:archease [Blastocatellia bacterium]MDW8412031.1 archease [Acidobacteriota bacterium]